MSKRDCIFFLGFLSMIVCHACGDTLDDHLLNDLLDRAAVQEQKLNDIHDVVTKLAQHLIPSFSESESCSNNGSNTGPKNCLEVQNKGNTESGVYTIYPFSNSQAVDVYCDLETDGGGWTVIQRRQDGSVSFARGWDEYRDGFGSPSGELWIGNELIHTMTSTSTSELRIELGDWDDRSVYAKYDSFRIGSEEEEFDLHLGAYSGTAGGDSFRHDNTGVQNGRKFSAIDRDNDGLTSSPHCAEKYECGFWFNRCFSANLNGVYHDGPTRLVDAKGIVWFHWKFDWNYGLKFTEMKIRPAQ